jgi:phospholipase C
MKSRLSVSLKSLSVCSALLLCSCGGGSGSNSQPSPTPATTYQLTVTAPASGAGAITSSPKGINCPSTCTASFAKGTQVTLTATPGSSYFFGGWSGACTGTNTCSLTMTAAETVAPTFTPGYGVTVAVTGTGTVTSSPAGISCPSAACSASFPQGTQVTLTETAGSGYSFGDWGGSCSGTGACTVTLSASANVTATFDAASGNALTVTTAGAGSGTVTSSPAGINCGPANAGACSYAFPPGTAVTLSATPATYNTFAGWSGACTGTTCAITVSGATAVTATFSGSVQANIQHIILFAQENRSLDHYFGAMQSYWQSIGLHQSDGVTFDGLAQFNPPVNGVTPPPATVPGCAAGTWGASCSPDASNPISSFHLQSVCMENQSPFWNEAHNQWDYADPSGSNMTTSQLNNPPLDGFAFTAAYDADSNGFMDLEGVRAMGYYDGTDLNYYYFLASNFATSDRWFAPIMSRTQLNRMYLIAATSHGQAYPIGQGCAPPPPGGTGGCPGSTNTGAQLPSTTIFEELQNAGVSWKIYVDAQDTVNTAGQSCSAMTGSEESACLVENSYINEFQYENTILNNPTLLANVQPLTTFATDAAAGTLPAFALIEPASDAGLDEHPSDSDEYPVNVQSGEAYAANNVIDTLMQSQSWSTSALIFTYDEWGGLYDHVPPQPATAPGDGPYDQGDPGYPTDLNPALNDICTGAGQLGNGMCSFSWTGYRVPMIVISPFARQNYVSHDVMDTTAVLALVEGRFSLSPLTNRDASYSLSQTTNANMAEFFNFTNPPWMTPPTPPIPTQYSSPSCSQVPVPGAYSSSNPQGGWGEPVNLSVAVSSGGGTITSSPPGISCNTDYTYAGTDSCGYIFPAGTSVTLTATPSSGSTFTEWSGENLTSGPCGLSTTPTCTITMNADEYVQANFQ